MRIDNKIKNITKWIEIDNDLLKLYKNPDSLAISEFIKDCKIITFLQRVLRKYIRGNYKTPFLEMINSYIILRNVFGADGICYLSIFYFSESDKLLEFFCSLPYYIDKQKISNRMSSEFLQWMKEKDNRRK